MPEKRGSPEDAEGAALQGPRDRAKAGLPELQSPAVEYAHPLPQRLMPRFSVADCSATRGNPFNFRGLPPPTGKAMTSEVIEGDEWGAYVTLERSAPPERGMA